jgi:hypothetical protein
LCSGEEVTVASHRSPKSNELITKRQINHAVSRCSVKMVGRVHCATVDCGVQSILSPVLKMIRREKHKKTRRGKELGAAQSELGPGNSWRQQNRNSR